MTTPAPTGHSPAVRATPRPERASAALDRRRIGVIVATEDPALLEVLVRCLLPGTALHPAGDAVTDATQLVTRLAGKPARVLLLDQRLLARLPSAALPSIAADFPKLRVLLVGERRPPSVVEDVARRHCHGFLLTRDLPETCARAVRTVNRGEIWLPRRLLEKALFASPNGVDLQPLPAAVGARLTGRERQTVQCAVSGLTNKQIAERLGVREDTIKKHLHSAYEKLGVQRRTQLIAIHSIRIVDPS